MTSWTLQNEKIILNRVPRVILNLWKLRLFTPTSKNDLFKTNIGVLPRQKYNSSNFNFEPLKNMD